MEAVGSLGTQGSSGAGILRFWTRLAAFVSIAAALVGAYLKCSSVALRAVHGPSTQEQIRASFKNALATRYDCLVLGNSRIYRGINPDQLWCPAFNFAHDNDSFNQNFYKLKFLEQHGVRFQYLLLGVDYFEFSFLSNTRNYIYQEYFAPEYLSDFKDTLNDRFNLFMSLKFSQTWPEVFNYYRDRLHGRDVQSGIWLKANGQLVASNRKTRDWWRGAPRRDGRRLAIEEAYFIKVLAYASEHRIKTFLIMPPALPEELASYDDHFIAEFEGYLNDTARQYGATYLNYSRCPQFNRDDFFDVTHLTSASADKFSRMVSSDVLNHPSGGAAALSASGRQPPKVN